MFQLIIPIQNKQKQFNQFNQYWTKKCGLGMELLPKVYIFFGVCYRFKNFIIYLLIIEEIIVKPRWIHDLNILGKEKWWKR